MKPERSWTGQTFPTLSPAETIPPMIEYFQKAGIEALGISSFGPLDLNPASPTYGYVTTTPKPGWGYCPLLPEFKKALGVPGGHRYRRGRRGAGRVSDGRGERPFKNCRVRDGGAPASARAWWRKGEAAARYGASGVGPHAAERAPGGSVAPRLLPLPRRLPGGPRLRDPAIDKRWGVPSRELPHDHIAWEIEAYYLAQFCVTALVAISTEKIVLGGGIMQEKFLFPVIREQTLKFLNGYVAADQVLNHIDELIVPPGLGIHSGVHRRASFGRRGEVIRRE